MFKISEVRRDCELLMVETPMADHKNWKVLRTIHSQLTDAPEYTLTLSWRILAMKILDTMLQEYSLPPYDPKPE